MYRNRFDTSDSSRVHKIRYKNKNTILECWLHTNQCWILIFTEYRLYNIDWQYVNFDVLILSCGGSPPSSHNRHLLVHIHSTITLLYNIIYTFTHTRTRTRKEFVAKSAIVHKWNSKKAQSERQRRIENIDGKKRMRWWIVGERGSEKVYVIGKGKWNGKKMYVLLVCIHYVFIILL